jgi:hypothetical protein
MSDALQQQLEALEINEQGAPVIEQEEVNEAVSSIPSDMPSLMEPVLNIPKLLSDFSNIPTNMKKRREKFLELLSLTGSINGVDVATVEQAPFVSTRLYIQVLAYLAESEHLSKIKSKIVAMVQDGPDDELRYLMNVVDSNKLKQLPEYLSTRIIIDKIEFVAEDVTGSEDISNCEDELEEQEEGEEQSRPRRYFSSQRHNIQEEEEEEGDNASVPVDAYDDDDDDNDDNEDDEETDYEEVDSP